LDSIKTPWRENPRLLGGSASHAAVAASFFAPVKLVGIVGEDFSQGATSNSIAATALISKACKSPRGKTFHWAGEIRGQHEQPPHAKDGIGRVENFTPELPEKYRRTPFVLLANIAPALQHRVLDQMRRPKLIVADTMDLWLNIALDDLLKLLGRIDVFVLNDSEARQLTKEDKRHRAAEKIHRLGPKYVIVKKGEHGAILSSPGGLFVAPAFPLSQVVDRLARVTRLSAVSSVIWRAAKARLRTNLKRGMIWQRGGFVFCQGFGLSRTTKSHADSH